MLLPLLWLKSFWKRLFLSGELLKLHSDRGTHFTCQILQRVCAIWPGLQHFLCTCRPQSSGLVKSTNDIIKTQLAELESWRGPPNILAASIAVDPCQS